MELVCVTDLVKSYSRQGHEAVNHVSFVVEKGETLVLLGPSGCGKTTILRLIAGFETPDQGRIEIEGHVVADQTLLLPPERRGVGMVFQEYALFPHLTVTENIAFGLQSLRREQRENRVREVLDHTGLCGLEKHYPHELSGGQQQRVALGRAMAPRPHLILLDEPFSNLDADLRSQLHQDVRAALRRTGTTAIFVTHDQAEAFVMGDRIGVLREGRLEQLDTPERIYRHPSCRFVASFVGTANFLPGLVEGNAIVTELGVLPLKGNERKMRKVEVVVHPDEIELRPGTEGEAQIVSRQYRGNHNFYTIRLPSGQHFHTIQPSHLFYETAAWVVPTLRVHDVAVFPRGNENNVEEEE
jgi:iron(III) transport system ATP-binding protein